MASQREIDEVEALLGRKPQGAFKVVVRSENGLPMVIENSPLLDDGRPMPTRFWLIDKDLVKVIGRIESTGGVKQAEAAVDPEELKAFHLRHNRERAEALPDGYDGPKPYGGVGGTRVGVKCLHAHYANFLVAGEDPVGRWVHDRLAEVPPGGNAAELQGAQEGKARQNEAAFAVYSAVSESVELSGATLLIHIDHGETLYIFGDGVEPKAAWVADVSGGSLLASYLTSDPPTAAQLSAALSIVELHVTDVLREVPGLAQTVENITVVGSGDVHLIAAVELGVDRKEVEAGVTLQAEDAEDLFRTLATEALADRIHNPGLPAERAGDIVGSLCVLLETLRQLNISKLRVAVLQNESTPGVAAAP